MHEFGHSFGLSHSLINQLSREDGSGATMFPFIDINDPGSEEEQRSPALDDVAWTSYLYQEGSASSGLGALQGDDEAFNSQFGLVTGEVTSGTVGGPVAGANVWLQDADTGQIAVSAFSGTTQLLIIPGETQITDADAGFFFGPDAEYSILNGNYLIPVPAGKYIVGMQSLDGLPAGGGEYQLDRHHRGAVHGSRFRRGVLEWQAGGRLREAARGCNVHRSQQRT